MAEPYRYDAFISYRRVEADRSFARDLMRQLEAAGYTVAIDERDFTSSALLMQEIDRCVRESRFTLAVVSRSYLVGAGMQDVVLARNLSDLEGRHRPIPIVIEAVEPPNWFEGLAPIDWTAPDPVPPLERLKKALGPPQTGDGPVSEEVLRLLPELLFRLVVAHKAVPELLRNFPPQVLRQALAEVDPNAPGLERLRQAHERLPREARVVQPDPLWLAWVRQAHADDLERLARELER